MNLYFLVEGYTETEFYPFLLEKLIGKDVLKRVKTPDQAISNNYYLIGEGGYPFIYTGPQIPMDSAPALKNAILDINTNPVYDYLILCLDADELSIEERKLEFEEYIRQFSHEGVELNKYCQLLLVVQNRAIETWFLGNKRVFKVNPNSEPMISYVSYYNVGTDDPEDMGNFRDVFTPQDFHFRYFKEMVRERTKKTYNKKYPLKIIDEEYISQMLKRVKETNHLKSFSRLVSFLKDVRNKIKSA